MIAWLRERLAYNWETKLCVSLFVLTMAWVTIEIAKGH
jgi:hypothetical protein